MRKKIAVFLGGYIPAKKYGGPVTSISNLVDSLGDEFNFYIISNDHDLDDYTRLPGIHDGWNQVGKAKVLYIKEKDYSTRIFKNILKKIDADCVYLSSVFYYKMNFPAIKAAKSLGISVIMAPRGELCEGALKKGYRKKNFFLNVINMFRVFDSVFFHVTSDEELIALTKKLKYHNDIFNIPNMPCAIYSKSDNIKKHGIVRVVYISRIVSKKNLLFAIRQINRCKAKVLFDIYGPLEETEYWEECKREIEKAPENIRIQYSGSIEPGTSQEVFSKYDVFVFPTLSENYGHVIVEAITSGCHLIVSKGTTPWDDIDQNGGYAIPLSNELEWTKVVDEIADMSEEDFNHFDQKLQKYVNKKISLNLLKKKYIKMFIRTIH